MHETFARPLVDPPRSPGSMPDSALWPCFARVGSPPHIACAAAYTAALGPLPDTAGTPTSCLRSSPHASAAPGFCGSHNELGPVRFPECAAEVPSLAPECSGTERWRRECAPHGTRAPGSPGTRRADSTPLGGDARALQFFCEHILQHGFVQAQLGDQSLQPRIFFLQLL